MRCPYCGSDDTQVKDSRPSEDNTSIRRRRVCADCGGRFTTFERIQPEQHEPIAHRRDDVVRLVPGRGAGTDDHDAAFP